MKKKIAVLVIVLAVLGLITALFFLIDKGSEDEEKDAKSVDRLKVVTTIYPQYDFVREIAGDKVDLKMLLKPGSESHSYEPSPQDIRDIENCDVFIYVGGESDVWVDMILDTIDNKDMKVISLMDCVDTVKEEVVEGMETENHDGHDNLDDSEEYYDLPKEEEHHNDKHHESEEEHNHNGDYDYDEHVWTSPMNAIKIVESITLVLEDVDKANKNFYEENSKRYIGELKKLDSEFSEVVKNGNKKTLVFGDRFPFRYFADRYDLNYYAAFPGCSSETEASASTVSFLIDKIEKEDIGVILKLELSKGNIAKSIKNGTDVKIMIFHSAHNISDEDFNKNISYLDIMKNNVKVLKEALK